MGDQAIAQVHVHLAEAGAAVEAALPLGELSQVRITAVPSHPAAGQPVVGRRSLLAVVAGPGLAEAVSSFGGVPVLATDGDVTIEQLAAAAQQTCRRCGDLAQRHAKPETGQRVATELRRCRTSSGHHPDTCPGSGTGRHGGPRAVG